MYFIVLIVIAWSYVSVMMAVAEASSPQGSILGALITFTLYGLLPMAILVYIMLTPTRKRRLQARREAEQRAYGMAQAAATQAPPPVPSNLPDAGGHAASAAEHSGIAPVRKKE